MDAQEEVYIYVGENTQDAEGVVEHKRKLKVNLFWLVHVLCFIASKMLLIWGSAPEASHLNLTSKEKSKGAR